MAIYLILLLLISNAFADDSVNSGGILNKGILITTVDGGTTVKAKTIKVSNGTLTDNSDGSATITTGGGNGWTSGPSVVYLTTSTDNVGIGSSAPNARLVIKDSGSLPAIGATTSAVIADTSASSDSGILSIISGVSGYSTINLGDTASETVGLIQYAHPRDSIDFRANSGIIMSVNGNQNVGIGTIIPVVEAAYRGLEIKAPTNAGATISLDTTDADRNPQIEFVENNVQKWKVFNENASDSLRFRTGATDVLTLTSGGNVGIGTTTPQGGLVVMNGNVGIGTTNPFGKLDVGSPSGSYRLTLSQVANFYGSDVAAGQVALYSTNAAAVDKGGSFSFGGENTVGAGATSPYIFAQVKGAKEGAANTYNGYLSFSTVIGTSAITEKMRITSVGNVGIGTTTPAGALTVMNGNVGIGTWAPAALLAVNGLTTSTSMSIGKTTAPATSFDILGNGLVSGFWDFSAGRLNPSASVAAYFATGNVGIGTTTPQGGLVVTNGNVGIGTWVPSAAGLTVRNGASNAGIWSLYGITISTSGQTFRATNNNYYMPYGTSSGSFNAQSEIASAKGIFFNIDTDNNDTDTSDVDTRFVFGHNGLTNASTALMAITEKGNVGIGTINPEGSLIVANGNVGIGSLAPGAALDLGTAGNIKIPVQKAITGTRYLCIDTAGNVSSSASACSGT